jgi:hypothetical protein
MKTYLTLKYTSSKNVDIYYISDYEKIIFFPIREYVKQLFTSQIINKEGIWGSLLLAAPYF